MSNIADMKKPELLALCREKKLIATSKTLKSELIKLLTIENNNNTNNPEISEVKTQIIDGKSITKNIRQFQFGNVAGGAGSSAPEKYQRNTIQEITGVKCNKTNMRINFRRIKLIEMSRPNIQPDGFDYTEDFDGVQEFEKITIYINMKCIVGKGGSQTRSLREVYHFIEAQSQVCLTNTIYNGKLFYFANILDGDEAHSTMKKYHYLINEYYSSISSRIYIGDLNGYFNWLEKLLENSTHDSEFDTLIQTEFASLHIA